MIFIGKIASKSFSFFGKSLSRVAGQKCCEYGQDGKPLSTEYVQNFINTASEEVKYWQPNEDYKTITHSWYFSNYLQAAAFALEIAKLDSMNVLKQQPNILIMKKEILRVELTTPKLGGLSKADLALATQISLMPNKDYSLVPILDEKNFRRELRMKKTNSNK
jgi:pterin-4a-carbinolamine dehydratase